MKKFICQLQMNNSEDGTWSFTVGDDSCVLTTAEVKTIIKQGKEARAGDVDLGPYTFRGVSNDEAQKLREYFCKFAAI